MGCCVTKTKRSKSFNVKKIPKLTENPEKIMKEYRMETLIKQVDSHYAVYTCMHLKTKKKYIMKKYHFGGRSEENIMQELEIYKKIDHPYLMTIIEYFKTDFCVFVIMQYFEGKNLAEYILEAVKFEENEVIKIVRQILVIVNYMHEKMVINRNLDLRNIMYDGNTIKIIGFGRATFFSHGQRFKEPVSNIHYRAPEMIKRHYNSKVDVWAAGVISYILMTGQPPFDADTVTQKEKNICEQPLDVEKLRELDVSEDAIDFLQKALCKQMNDRLKADDLLKHKWLEISIRRNSDLKLNKQIVKNLQEYSYKDNFQRAIYSFLVTKLAHENERKLALKEFQKLDEDKNGVLTKGELTKGLKRLSIHIDQEDINKIFKKLDKNQNGVIEYTNFLEAVVDREEFLQEENINKCFDYLDVSKSGTITINDLEKVFGDMINSGYVRKKFQKYSNSSYINKKNFIRMLKDITLAGKE